MWWHKKLLSAVVIGTIVSGCGFSPVYKQGVPGEDNRVVEKLSAISVEPMYDRMGQELYTHLLHKINPESKNVTPEYKLDIHLKKESVPLAIQQDREITRYNIVLTAKYNLIKIADGKQIANGKVKIVGGYDVVDSQFAAYVAEKDATNRIAREMAEEFKIRLTAALLKQGQ